MGLFAVMIIAALILQEQTMQTIQNVKNSERYTTANDLGNSALEILQYKINKEMENVPFNYKVDCKFSRGFGNGDLALLEGSDNTLCMDVYDELLIYYNSDYYKNDSFARVENVEIKLNVVGHGKDEAGLADTTECYAQSGGRGGALTPCYIAPFPWTGTAGENCDQIDPETITGDPIDHPCNWNKLEFGSNLTDRVSIPLYYANEEDGGIVNNFFGVASPQSPFAIKIRTPCETDTIMDVGTICGAYERMELDETENNIVAQWQISGTCTDESGVYCEEGKPVTYVPDTNAVISENVINLQNTEKNNKNIIVKAGLLENITKVISTSLGRPPVDGLYAVLKDLITDPTLILFLSHPLKTTSKNIPYLEYQIVSKYPIADSRIQMSVTVVVDGNVYEKTLYKENQKGLVDFVIQN